MVIDVCDDIALELGTTVGGRIEIFIVKNPVNLAQYHCQRAKYGDSAHISVRDGRNTCKTGLNQSAVDFAARNYATYAERTLGLQMR